MSDWIYLQMCVRRYKAAGVIFVHIPKSAGTSVANATIGRRAGHFTAQQIRKQMGTAYDKLFKFAVVRHPRDRLLSAYSFARKGSTGSGAIRNPAQYQGQAFRSFDAFVEEWLDTPNPDDLRTRNVIFQPQSDFIFAADRLLVDYVGKVEAMGEVSQTLSERLRRELHIGHENRSGHSSDFESAYTPTTRKIVERLYAQDFENFQYD
ncbi:MAG: sulfotransferase family 2 domain-containing protein [Hyphomicrobiales bacterium]